MNYFWRQLTEHSGKPLIPLDTWTIEKGVDVKLPWAAQSHGTTVIPRMPIQYTVVVVSYQCRNVPGIQTCKEDLNHESRRMYFRFSCLERPRHSVDWEQGREGQVVKDHHSSEYGEASEFHHRQVRHCRYQIQCFFNACWHSIYKAILSQAAKIERDRGKGRRRQTIKTNDHDPFWPSLLYLNFIFLTSDSPSSFFEGFGASYPLWGLWRQSAAVIFLKDHVRQLGKPLRIFTIVQEQETRALHRLIQFSQSLQATWYLLLVLDFCGLSLANLTHTAQAGPTLPNSLSTSKSAGSLFAVLVHVKHQDFTQ